MCPPDWSPLERVPHWSQAEPVGQVSFQDSVREAGFPSHSLGLLPVQEGWLWLRTYITFLFFTPQLSPGPSCHPSLYSPGQQCCDPRTSLCHQPTDGTGRRPLHPPSQAKHLQLQVSTGMLSVRSTSSSSKTESHQACPCPSSLPPSPSLSHLSVFPLPFCFQISHHYQPGTL